MRDPIQRVRARRAHRFADQLTISWFTGSFSRVRFVSATSCYTLIVNSHRARWNAIAAVFFLAASVLTGVTAPPPRDSAESAKAVAQHLEDHYRHAQTLRAVFLERWGLEG